MTHAQPRIVRETITISDRERAAESVRILRKARRLIASGHKEFICTAIEKAATSRTHASRLCGRVESVLDGHFTMDSWALVHSTGVRSMRRLRLRWLDAWIAAIEKKYGLRGAK